MITGPLPGWDLERRRIDVAPFTQWVYETAASFDARLADVELAQWHHHVDADGALALSHHLTLMSRGMRPRRLVHAMLCEAIPFLRELAHEVVVQTAAHVRVLVPGDTMSPAPMHTDRAIGHGLDERNVWIALTDARSVAALHVVPLARSLLLEQRRMKAGTIDVDYDGAARREARPIDVARGDVLLFTPVHVHGACVMPRDANVTRVSLDVRIAPARVPRSGAGFSFVPLELELELERDGDRKVHA